MSYTSTLKSNLFSSPPREEETVRAELSALLSSEAHFYMAEDEITCHIRTDSFELARYIKSQIESTFGLSGRLQIEETNRFGRQHSYELIFENASEFLQATGTVKEGPFGFYNPVLNTIFEEEEPIQSAFLRGIFLSCGSVSDPEQNFHMEIDGLNEAVAETCLEILEGFGIGAHLSEKRLYLKDAQSIAEFLRIIGAEEAAESVEKAAVLRQVRSDINRQVNCETANLKKIARAADREIEAIEFLIDKGSFSKLDPKLQTAALMRLDAPSLSISELAESAKPKVSRSTLYRRLRQIVERAEALREDDKGE